MTATYDETVTGTVTVTLNNTGTASLTCSGTTCTGDYTVGATGSGEDITGLTVSTIDTENVTDANGNNETGSTLPATNIATGSSINVDTTAPTLPTVTVASSYTPSDEAIQSSTVTLSLTADEAIVSTPTVVVSASDSDPIGSCSAPTDVSAGARTSWDAECVISTTDAEGIMSFTIDFEDDYGNDGVQVTSTTDASTVTIKHYGSGGGSGALSTRGQDSTDEEEDEEELIDNDESEQEEEE